MNQPHTPAADTAANDQPKVISAEAMNTALAEGKAVYLSQVMTGFASYDAIWWVEEIGRWLEVDDPALIDFLDKHYEAAAAMQALFDKG